MDYKLRYDRIRSLMRDRDFSAGQVAYRSGLSVAQIYRRLSGKRPRASGVTLAKLARALGTTTDYLLGLSSSPTPTEADLQLSALEHRILQLFRLLPTWLQHIMVRQVQMWIESEDLLPSEGTPHVNTPSTDLHSLGEAPDDSQTGSSDA